MLAVGDVVVMALGVIDTEILSELHVGDIVGGLEDIQIDPGQVVQG